MINVFMDIPVKDNTEDDGEIQEDDADYEYYYDEDDVSGEAVSDEGDMESRGYTGGLGRGLQALQSQTGMRGGLGRGLQGRRRWQGGAGVGRGVGAPYTRFGLKTLGRGNRRLGVSAVSSKFSNLGQNVLSSEETKEDADYEEYLDDYSYTTADAAVDATNSKYDVGLEGPAYNNAIALAGSNNLDRRISVAMNGNRGLGMYGKDNLAHRNGAFGYQGLAEKGRGAFANIGGRRFEGYGAGFGISSPDYTAAGGGAGAGVGIMGRDYGGGWGGDQVTSIQIITYIHIFGFQILCLGILR